MTEQIKQPSAAAKLAAAHEDIRAAIYAVLRQHGIEYGRVSPHDLLGGEYRFDVIVHDHEQLDPRYVEVSRIPEPTNTHEGD